MKKLLAADISHLLFRSFFTLGVLLLTGIFFCPGSSAQQWVIQANEDQITSMPSYFASIIAVIKVPHVGYEETAFTVGVVKAGHSSAGAAIKCVKLGDARGAILFTRSDIGTTQKVVNVASLSANSCTI